MENILEQYRECPTERLRIEITNWAINRPFDVVALCPEDAETYNRVQFQRRIA